MTMLQTRAQSRARLNHKGDAPLAHAVAADNPRFTPAAGKQRLYEAVVVHGEWDADVGDVPEAAAARLAAGINYVLVTFDLTDRATPGTAPDIDFVWPSDHAAVLTTFDVQP